MKEIIIDDTNSNQRLDKLLKRILVNAEGGFVYKMLRKKNITLNGKKATGSETVKVGDSIKIFFSDETFEKLSGMSSVDPYYEVLKSYDNNIDIIFEDEEKIIINKPCGILSQKAVDSDVSINEMALSYLINKGELSPEDFNHFHPSVVNRLDRNTSGIVLFAKTLKAARELSEALKERSCRKIYRAIVLGKVSEKELIDGYLYKDEATNKVCIYDHEVKDAKPIKTEYEPVKALSNDLTLISIHLITGRTHQIRAHLASIGHPILGDFKYGDAAVNKKLNAKSQLLHAYEITFENGESYRADLRKDFNVYL